MYGEKEDITVSKNTNLNVIQQIYIKTIYFNLIFLFFKNIASRPHRAAV